MMTIGPFRSDGVRVRDVKAPALFPANSLSSGRPWLRSRPLDNAFACISVLVLEILYSYSDLKVSKGGVIRDNLQRRFLAQSCCTKNRCRATRRWRRFFVQYFTLQHIASFWSGFKNLQRKMTNFQQIDSVTFHCRFDAQLCPWK